MITYPRGNVFSEHVSLRLEFFQERLNGEALSTFCMAELNYR